MLGIWASWTMCRTPETKTPPEGCTQLGTPSHAAAAAAGEAGIRPGAECPSEANGWRYGRRWRRGLLMLPTGGASAALFRRGARERWCLGRVAGVERPVSVSAEPLPRRGMVASNREILPRIEPDEDTLREFCGSLSCTFVIRGAIHTTSARLTYVMQLKLLVLDRDCRSRLAPPTAPAARSLHTSKTPEPATTVDLTILC